MWQIALLGVAQILLWGGSYFLLSVLAAPIMEDRQWSYQQIYGCLSLALLIAGLLLPRIGRLIDTAGLNVALQNAGIVMAVGLVLVGLAQHYSLFITGWVIIGLAMAMGLYDALFASLGKQYGHQAHKAIVQVTLISCLAPSISWAFSSFLLQQFGWRNTCFVYALLLVLVIWPIHRYVFRVQDNRILPVKEAAPAAVLSPSLFRSPVYYLILFNFTIGALLNTGIVIYLIDILSARGMVMASVLAMTALLGPSQAAARAIELILPGKSVLGSAVWSGLAHLAGILLLLGGAYTAALAVVLFGLGNGMRSILRGTLPLHVFGKEGYPVIIGRLGRLPLIAQAIAPFAGGLLIARAGMTAFLVTCASLAAINLVAVIFIRRLVPQSPREKQEMIKQ
ncbi:MFS transporter [Paraflavitalea pollutisoli]|uniref:MFS transporter n=1 Tax=Paraflavitalea pollutisoli TaxID=3034143 RepID=UPI0023EBF8D0|nr:MFS transporter [Paraflavitalea sp. H1-2-19X]